MTSREDGYFQGSAETKLEMFGEKLDRIETKVDAIGDRVTKLEMAKVFLSGGKAMLVLIGGLIFEGVRLAIEAFRHK